MLVHSGVNAFLAGQPLSFFERVQVFLAGQRAFGLRLHKQILTEVGHFLLGVSLIELDDFFQGVHRGLRTQPGQVGVQVSLEFVKQDLVFLVTPLAPGGEIGGINQSCALALHLGQCLFHKAIHFRIESKSLAHHSQAGAP